LFVLGLGKKTQPPHPTVGGGVGGGFSHNPWEKRNNSPLVGGPTKHNKKITRKNEKKGGILFLPKGGKKIVKMYKSGWVPITRGGQKNQI